MHKKIQKIILIAVALSAFLSLAITASAGRWLAMEQREEYKSGGDLYTNGTLLKKKNEKTIYYIHQGKKLRVPHSVLQSSLKNKQIIEVPLNKFLDQYEYGGVLTHRMGTLVQEKGSNTVYKISRDDKKQAIPSYAIFRDLGYKIENVNLTPTGEMGYYKTAKNITATGMHTDGDLVSFEDAVYVVQDKELYHIANPFIFQSYGFEWSNVLLINYKEFQAYKYIKTLPYAEGALIRAKGAVAIYIIENNQKRNFESGEVFTNLGYQFKNILDLPQNEFNKIKTGRSMGFKDIE